MKFKTTIELEVEVVGHYEGATMQTYDEPGQGEGFEVEAVLLHLPKLPGEAVHGTLDILGGLSPVDVEELAACGVEQARESLESDYIDAQIAREEARRDAKEDR